MTSVNIEVASADLSKKPQKQAWYDRRWPIFSSRKVSKQNSKKRKEQLANNSEVLSTTSHDSAKTSNQSRGSVSSHTDPTCAHKDTASLNSASTDSDSLVECLLCLTSQPADEYPILTTCQHQTCLSCLRQYLQVEISESRVNLTCPACQEKFHPSDVISILQDNGDLLLKWEEFLLRRTLSIDPDCRWCPAPDCGYAVIAYGCASCPRLECKRPGCNTEFCYHCRQEWHHNQTCDSAHLQRTKQLRIRTDSGAYSQGSSGNDDIKPCPKCGAFIVKMNDGSCNHMTCTVCDAEFCWLCLQEITDLHYLSPSGCTFWGKKPWSKKKKIIWQLGLLIGAPLGIALVAGVAVPAIMIGLPVWIGKKVVNKLRKANASKHQKNLAAVGAVSASILISPALAGVAVAIGVPVLLLYVYGVVPISLYRTGSGTGGKGQPMASNVAAMIPGLRFDISSSALATRPMSQEEGSNFQPRSNQSAMVTPSIGEGSVGGVTMGSLNISHASNLDKLARGDQDGASTVAMAGTSITGSISGVSSGFNPPMRNEIQVKETDQHSIQTHMSACSNTAGITSVQIHVTDDVSLHSSTSMRGNVKRTYSSKRSLNRNTARQNKGSSFPSTSSAKASEEQSGLEPAVSIQESNCVLTIVDESPYSSHLDNTTLHESHITIESDQSNCITTEAKSELPTGSAESSRFSSL